MNYFAGVDEAGRGPLAGSVVAAAVIFESAKVKIKGLTDSKLLTELQRERLYEKIITSAISYAVGIASVEEIDRINILQATLLAMQRAIAGLAIIPSEVLIDGNQIPKNLAIPARAIIHGDNLIPAISAASIIAKVTRDRYMKDMHKLYPQYNFAQNKGYYTQEHLAAIRQHGACILHRKSFAPIKELV